MDGWIGGVRKGETEMRRSNLRTKLLLIRVEYLSVHQIATKSISDQMGKGLYYSLTGNVCAWLRLSVLASCFLKFLKIFG